MEGQLIVATPLATPLPTPADARRAVEATPDDARRVLFDFNKHALAQSMRTLGSTSVAVTYSGCGDSGQIDEVGFQPADVDEGVHQVVVAQMQYHWDAERACGVNAPAFVEMPLSDVAEALCDTAVELAGHNGYENGDGGEGTFTLQAADACAELEHRDFYTESDTSWHTL